MKKFLSIVFLSILFTQSCIAIEDSTISKPTWLSVSPVQYQNVSYIEPIKRPKWAKPLAWFGWVGTCFLVPFPLFMDDKDNNIALNNTWVWFKEQFEKDVNDCEKLYKQEKELYQCYQNVQNKHIQYLNMQLGNYNAQQIQSLQQLQIIQQSYK